MLKVFYVMGKALSGELSQGCTDLEKSLKMSLVLEKSWNSKKVHFVLELTLNFEKISLIITKSP